VSVGLLEIERLVSGPARRRIGRVTAWGRLVEIVDSVPSTNDLAWARAGDPRRDGLVVLAEQQTAGRGRRGRSWESPRGASLLCSVLLLPRQHTAASPAEVSGGRRHSGPLLALLAAVACCDAIFEATSVSVEIKWPNDLLAGGRKLGGILVESRPWPSDRGSGARGPDLGNAHVVGIGINCLQHRGHFPPDLRERATSLDLQSAGPIDRGALAVALLRHLDRCFADESIWTAEEVRQEWLRHAVPLGSRVMLEHGGRRYTGHVIDVDPTAALVVQLDRGGRRLFDAANTTILND